MKPVAKTMCASCIFREDGQAELNPGRLDEIRAYLLNGTPHLCHWPAVHGNDKTELVCRGGRDFQLTMWFRLGLLAEPTDESLHAKMKELGLDG